MQAQESTETRAARALGAVVLAALLILLLGSVRAPLIDPDEARFARTSVEMLRSGDPVVPTFEGQPRLVKPPLAHWLQTGADLTEEPEEPPKPTSVQPPGKPQNSVPF